MTATIVLLSLVLGLIPSRAGADPVSTGVAAAKFLADKLFSAMAAEVYNNDCTSDEPSSENFMCGVLGSYSGAKETRWRAKIEERLSSLSQQLSTLERGQEALGLRLDEIIAQNQALFRQVALVVPEGQAQRAVTDIEAIWEYRYLPLFESTDAFNREAITGFAAYIAQKDLPLTVGGLAGILTGRGFGSRSPLIEQWAETIQENLGANAGDRAVESAYDRLEMEVSILLLRVRQGMLMARLAREVMESECQLQPSSRYCLLLLPEHQHLRIQEEKAVRDIIKSFNRAVDYLVLAQSDPHSRQPNFLPGVASDIYRRADLLSAASLGEPGLRGRVISMGDAWDGQIRRQDFSNPVTPRSIEKIKTYGGPVDWWKGEGSYTEVSLSSEWKVYHYFIRDNVGRSGWSPPRLPFDSGPFSSGLIDLSTGTEVPAGSPGPTMRFGSFFGIERAGGGYALLSGSWTKGSPYESFAAQTDSELKERTATADAGTDPLRAHVSWRATAGANRRGKDRFTGKREIEVKSDKRIVYPAGGKLVLTVVPDPGPPGQSPAGQTRTWAGGAAAVALSSIDQDKTLTYARSSQLSGRLALVLGPAASSNGVVISRSQQNKSGTLVTETIDKWAGSRSAAVDLTAGQAYPLTLSAELSFDVWPGGYNTTTWEQLVRGRFSNVYLSAPK
ncbi:MAG: hypothetical protein HC897_01130 [Thermoanaerobaculia bacterium]|nr:hypothetical protein [Thermoanaerobaculia bacterium]